MRSRKLALLLGALLAAACGARTTLGDNDEDNDLPIEVLGGSGGGNTSGSGGAAAGKAGAGGAGAGGAVAGQGGAGQAGAGQAGAGQAGLDGGLDAKPDADAQADAHDDVVVTDTGCKSDASCDDQVDCTEDACVNGVCTHTTRDILCDDKLFCTGQERCDAALGCVAGAPINCEDGVACTVGTCNEQTQSCDLTPNDSLCPLSHKCGLGEGCYALAYAHTPASLYEIRLPSGKVTFIGSIMTQLTDIALQSNTQLYGLSFTTLFNVDTTTGEAFFLQNVDASGMVAFDVSPGGKFYVGGGSNVFEMDTQSAQTVAVGSYPPGWEASGDLAFLQGRMLATARLSNGGGGNDMLVEIDLQGTGESKILGATGYGCVWGLAAFGETLYGLTCNGEVLNINPDTGASQLLSKGDQAFWGASAR